MMRIWVFQILMCFLPGLAWAGEVILNVNKEHFIRTFQTEEQLEVSVVSQGFKEAWLRLDWHAPGGVLHYRTWPWQVGEGVNTYRVRMSLNQDGPGIELGEWTFKAYASQSGDFDDAPEPAAEVSRKQRKRSRALRKSRKRSKVGKYSVSLANSRAHKGSGILKDCR